ncbi:MAG: response regulator [bacterium]
MIEKSNKIIMIVEDDEALGKMYFDRVLAEGYGVVLVTDGQEAQNKLLEGSHHFVLLDIMLPNRNGIEILEVIRSNESTKELPVIMLSAFPKPEYLERINLLGVVDFFNKAATTPGEVVYKINQNLFPEL